MRLIALKAPATSVKKPLSRRGHILSALALVLALLPSCSEARSNKPTLSPQAERLVNDAADLLFGNSNMVPPIVNVREPHTSAGYWPSCYGDAEELYKNKEKMQKSEKLRSSMNIGLMYTEDSDIFCGNSVPMDKNISYDSPRVDKNFLHVTYNLTNNMNVAPLFRRPAEQYMDGYFAKSHQFCQLWVRRNEIGKINVAAIRILSKGSELFSVEDHQQQECFIRGSLAALGLRGAAELPFEQLAYRSPFPMGLDQSVLPSSKMRRRVAYLSLLIFQALPDHVFEPFTKAPIKRGDFVAALAGWPNIEKAAGESVRLDVMEQAERNAKAAPLSPQSGLVTVLCRSPISLCHLGFERERADATQI